MTVKELIEELRKLPPDAKVFYDDGAYLGSTSPVSRVDYNKTATLATPANTVFIS